MESIDSFRFERHGFEFIAKLYEDDNNDAPWERDDGHGPVRTTRCFHGRPGKRAGEVVLFSERGYYVIYDAKEATALARRDGWGIQPEKRDELRQRYRQTGNVTKRSDAALAVFEDERFLRGWLNNDWYYVGVAVQMTGSDDDRYQYAVWGVESDCEDYIRELADELADESLRGKRLLPEQRREDWLAALKEARERRYWAQRDVVTAEA